VSFPPISKKPIAEIYRPELTRLSKLTFLRKLFRRLMSLLCWVAVKLLVRIELKGIDNFPKKGPAIVVTNHLGDADLAIALSYIPKRTDVEIIGKVELYDYPILGKLMDWYGVIWIHRGQPDRKTLKCALQALFEGRIVSIAPEGRYSLTKSLEEGTHGAAYLAYKADVPLLPITFVGTDNENVFGNLKHYRRPKLKVNIGKIFKIDYLDDWRSTIETGTLMIMTKLAEQLPKEYQGVYRHNNK